MRESPRLTDEEIKDWYHKRYHYDRDLDVLGSKEIELKYRELLNLQLSEVLKWVVEDLREQRDWLEKQTPHPNTQLGHRFKQSTLRIFNKLISDKEIELEAIRNEYKAPVIG